MDQFALTPRMKQVADFVPEGASVADIGCDHAYISIYVCQKRGCRRAIAMDVREGPLMHARENIHKAGLADTIELRCSDGLDMLGEAEADTIVMAGMGGPLMMRLLARRISLVEDMSCLVLQPQSELGKVRKYIYAIGFCIVEEAMVWDKKKPYFILKCERKDKTSQKANWTELEFIYGRHLLHRQDAGLYTFLTVQQESLAALKEKLIQAPGKKASARLCEIEAKLEYNRAALAYYTFDKEAGMGEVTVEVYGEQKNVQYGTQLIQLAQEYAHHETYDIVLAYMGDRLCELNKTLKENTPVRFVTTADKIGNEAYRRSATLIMLKAVDDVLGRDGYQTVRVMYSISKGYYCEVTNCKRQMDTKLLEDVKTRMREIVDEDIPIQKRTLNTDEVCAHFKRQGMTDKEKLFQYRRVSQANIYSIGDYEDYFYGYMVPSAGYIKYFDLFLYGEGFVLQMPVAACPDKVPAFAPQRKLFHVLKQSDDWGKRLEVDTVGALNDVISDGNIGELMLVQEALQEKGIADIAEQIAREEKRIVLVAGPSSSGKTSFSHRLSIQLRAQGLKPHPIGMDDYFVDRQHTPRDADGNYDFECLGALDVQQFHEDMLSLLEGREVKMPFFNFHEGKRQYKGNTLKIGTSDVLVIEGIHGLNPALSGNLPADSIFRVYISALTQLNVDEHNRIATTDGRLIRRIVRDDRKRRNSAKTTIAMWTYLRRGEEQNIFPYQENADAMFNSALIYELSVIKQYAEPLLFAIPKHAPEYQEAKRLLKF